MEMFILLMVVALILAGVYGWYATANEGLGGEFSSTFQGERTLDLSKNLPKDEAKQRQAYADKHWHVRPSRLEFMDRVEIFEGMYLSMREEEGWVLVKGGRNDPNGDRFIVEWRFGKERISAEQDEWDGTITEKKLKPKIN